MPHTLLNDIECQDLVVKSDAEIRGLDVTSGNITTATCNAVTATTLTAVTANITNGNITTANFTNETVSAVNATSVTTTTVTATNVDFRRGQLQRSFGVIRTKDDIGSTGVAPHCITMPAKAYISRFGFMSSGSDIVIATTFNAVLQTSNATVLGTAFVADADYTLGTYDATKVAFTATSVRANHGVQVNVATAGKSGSVYWFVDYRLNST